MVKRKWKFKGRVGNHYMWKSGDQICLASVKAFWETSVKWPYRITTLYGGGTITQYFPPLTFKE